MPDYVIPNLSKACQLLTYIVGSSRGMTRDEISVALNIPRSTTYRMLQTLVNESFVEQKKYQYYPGAGLYTLGLQLNSVDRLRPIVRPILQHLSNATGLTSHLAIPSGYKSLLLDVCDGNSLSRLASRPGTLSPVHVSATGKVFLAYLFTDDLAVIEKELGFEKFTDRTNSNIQEVRNEIQVTLKRGYAVDEREFSDGVRCLACPLFDMSGSVVASIGVTASVEHFPPSRIPDVAALVKEHAKKCYQILKDQG